jgi:hypothetical protein
MNFLKRYKTKFLSLMLALLFCGVVANAQVPVQTKGFFGQGQTEYKITLDQPILAGQAIVLAIYDAGAPWSPGPVCSMAAPFCDYNFYDSLGNQFVQVNKDNSRLLYVPASKGGAEMVTIENIYSNNVAVVIVVFPVTLVLQDVEPPRCDFIPLVGQNRICQWHGDSTVGTDDTSVLTSYPLISSVPNELFIGYGAFGLNGFSFLGGDGWADPVMSGSDPFLSYKTSGAVGTQETFTVYPSPAIPEGHYAYMGIQGFKVILIQ